MSQDQIVNKDDLVIRFAGDSGDGMQLSGTLFSDASALRATISPHSPTIPPKSALRTTPLPASAAIRYTLARTSTAQATSATSSSL